MIKKILALLLVSLMIFSLSAFAESEKPTIVVSNHNKDIIELSGTAPDNQKATITVLNPGYTIEDLNYGTWQELTSKIVYTQSTRTASGKYTFNIPLKDNAGIENGGGIFNIYVTIGSGPYIHIDNFEFYYNSEKLSLIEEINNADEITEELLEKAAKKFSILNDTVYSQGNKSKICKALTNIKNSCDNSEFPLDANEFASFLETALIIGGVNADKKNLLISDDVLSERVLMLFDNESVDDYLNSLSKSGRISLNVDLFAPDYNLLFNLSEKFNELIALYVISDYKMSGYGHIEGFLEKYETRYENAGFELDKFNNIKKNKNKFFSNYFKRNASTLNGLAKNFNSAITAFLTPKPVIDSGSSSSGGGFSGGGGGGGMPSPGKVTSGNETVPNIPVPETVVPVSFSDISGEHWAGEAIKTLAEKKIVAGYADGTFKPDATLTRAELTKLVISLCNALEIELSSEHVITFSDVSENDWFADVVKTASAAGLINGANGSFAPNESISRQDTAVVLYRLLSGKIQFGPSADFSDKAEISDYAGEAVSALAGEKIINGMGDGRFAPNEKLTRAQAVQLIYGVYNKLKGGAQ